jgi:NAD(P)-dependent dehydrogenase (short-subunit alcohol dehydrogenase family)
MKIAIITGASGNLGQAAIKKFIEGGYFVIGTVVSGDPMNINFPASSFERVVVDLLNEDDSQEFVDTVISKYGRIRRGDPYGGGICRRNIAETKTSDINRQYKLNFETAYNIARPAFVPDEKAKPGSPFYYWLPTRS